jgi:chromosome segregation ATPase
MSFSSGVVGQGLSLQALSPQVSALNLQSFGNQGIDLSDLRSAQELELHTTHLAALQAARDAQNKAYSASMQRIRTHLSSITPEAVKPKTQSTDLESCCDQIKHDLSELKTTVTGLQQQITDLKKVCDEIKKNQKQP